MTSTSTFNRGSPLAMRVFAGEPDVGLDRAVPPRLRRDRFSVVQIWEHELRRRRFRSAVGDFEAGGVGKVGWSLAAAESR